LPPHQEANGQKLKKELLPSFPIHFEAKRKAKKKTMVTTRVELATGNQVRTIIEI
jgi:hypothetical protein